MDMMRQSIPDSEDFASATSSPGTSPTARTTDGGLPEADSEVRTRRKIRMNHPRISKILSNFIKKLMDNKLLTIRAAENVVRILPPLNVKKSELNLALKIIKKVCANY